MNEFAVLSVIFRKVVPVVATGLDRTFRLVGSMQRSSTAARSDVAGAGGVPAARTVEIPGVQTMQPPITQHAEPMAAPHSGSTIAAATTPSSGAAGDTAAVVAIEQRTEPDHQGEEDDLRQEDDLDWAGSLAHAAAASLHIGNILAMVRAGWLIPDTEQLAGITAALDAMEAFHARTDMAVAPVLAAMNEDQQADFLSDFDADLPVDLPELDGA